MAWFRCFIRGENFPGQLAGEDGPVGFYVTRFVEATDAAAAESVALQALRAELTPPPGYMPSGQARVYFEEIEKLPVKRVPAVLPGFVWHPMEDTDAEPDCCT
jgi:hypothetical protein